jgi:hypothetical protein
MSQPHDARQPSSNNSTTTCPASDFRYTLVCSGVHRPSLGVPASTARITRGYGRPNQIRARAAVDGWDTENHDFGGCLDPPLLGVDIYDMTMRLREVGRPTAYGNDNRRQRNKCLHVLHFSEPTNTSTEFLCTRSFTDGCSKSACGNAHDWQIPEVFCLVPTSETPSGTYRHYTTAPFLEQTQSPGASQAATAQEAARPRARLP